MDLKSQRRLAASILKVGESRIWIDPTKMDEVESAITREEIRRLIHEGVIRAQKKKGVSRARARIIHQKKKKGLRRGPGSRSGALKARQPRKKMWMMRIRALRRRLRLLKEKHIITRSTYRKLYIMAKSGTVKSVADLKRYIKAHRLERRK
ncbi:TPA: 50S ribosomal protein L19e [Candidatus Bathyarchaeota archaeon]|nr:50S ribosomal protein L19e [Candidatus Bathyarchaeota archaeon]